MENKNIFVNPGASMLFYRKTVICLMISLLPFMLVLWIIGLIPFIVVFVSGLAFFLIRMAVGISMDEEPYHFLIKRKNYKYKIICISIDDSHSYIPMVKRYFFFPYEFLEGSVYNPRVYRYNDYCYGVSLKGVCYRVASSFATTNEKAKELINNYKTVTKNRKEKSVNIVEVKLK